MVGWIHARTHAHTWHVSLLPYSCLHAHFLCFPPCSDSSTMPCPHVPRTHYTPYLLICMDGAPSINACIICSLSIMCLLNNPLFLWLCPLLHSLSLSNSMPMWEGRLGGGEGDDLSVEEDGRDNEGGGGGYTLPPPKPFKTKQNAAHA